MATGGSENLSERRAAFAPIGGDLIAVSKLRSFEWQTEFRFVFSVIEALDLYKAKYELVPDSVLDVEPPRRTDHPLHCATVDGLSDICTLRSF
jgi:hypothetical protein